VFTLALVATSVAVAMRLASLAR